VVNARHVKALPGRKTDVADAQWLATLLAPACCGVLSCHRRRCANCGWSHDNARNWWVNAVPRRTGCNKALIDGRPLHEVLDRKGRLRADRNELFEALSTEQFSETHRFVAEEILAHIEELEQRIARMDRYLLEGLKAHEAQLTLLQTVPGIDRPGAAMLLVEIGTDMSVFGSAERIASWVGICPGNNESTGKRKSGRIRRGNPWVRRLLCEFAQAAARTRCGLKAKFESLMIRKGYKKAIVALAHKMLRILYAMLSSRTHYQDSTIDYEALTVARNAPRWLKMLRKHGFITDAVTCPPEGQKRIIRQGRDRPQGFARASGWLLPH